jgi:hypothetical protein
MPPRLSPMPPGLPPVNVSGLPPANVSGIARVSHVLHSEKHKKVFIIYDEFYEECGSSEAEVVAELVVTVSDSSSSGVDDNQQAVEIVDAELCDAPVTSNTTETWASFWVARSLGYVMPKDEREEWLGDLMQVNRELPSLYPRWWINVIIIARVIRLLVSALEIKISDFISLGVRKSE